MPLLLCGFVRRSKLSKASDTLLKTHNSEFRVVEGACAVVRMAFNKNWKPVGDY